MLQKLFGDRAVFESVGADLFDEAEIDLLTAAGRPGTKRAPWTLADQLLLDETASLLNGPPFVFGHLVVDEAQDQSAVGLRVIGRRSPSGSMTILGDLAQSTTPAGQRDWDDVLGHLGASAGEVAHLTIGYRVPAPILDVANRLLPLTGVDTVPSRSVRLDGAPPQIEVVAEGAVVEAAVARGAPRPSPPSPHRGDRAEPLARAARRRARRGRVRRRRATCRGWPTTRSRCSHPRR